MVRHVTQIRCPTRSFRRFPTMALAGGLSSCPMNKASASAVPSSDPSSRRLQGIARGSFLNLVAGGVAAIATFALTVVLTRSISAEVVGVFFTTTSLFLLLTSLGQLGTSTGLVYFLARARTEGEPSLNHEYLRTAALPVLILAGTCTLLLFVLAPTVSSWMGADAGNGITQSLRLLSLFVLLAALLNLYTSASRGLGTMRPTAVLDQAARPALQLILVALAIPLDDIRWIVLAWSLPYLPTALAARTWWKSMAGPRPPVSGDHNARLYRDFWRFTAPRSLASVAQAIMQRLDIVLVGALAGLAEAAIYTAATRFLVLGQLAGTSVSRAVQPKLARAISKGDHDSAQSMYRSATAWLVLLVWPFYLVLAFASEPLLRLFGSEYEAGASVVVILALTMLVATACGMVDVVLTMAGRTTWNLYNVLVALVVNVALDLILIPDLGILGAALGWAAAILVANLLPLIQIASVLRTHPFGRATLTACGLAGLCFGALPAGVTLLIGSGTKSVLLALALAVVLYLILVALARHILNLGDVFAGLTKSPSRPI